jgi:hypothetical protein
MPTTIIHKIGRGVPSADDLVVGEIAQDENTGTLYVKKSDGSVAPVGSDSAGAGMVIQPDEPADPATGLQWLESTTGRVWIWDENKWLEFPASSPQSAPVIVSEDEPADPVIGQLWYKPSEGAMYVYDGNDWQAFGSGGDGGGNPPIDGTSVHVEMLLVAGGGGGGSKYAGGGGGSGGLLHFDDLEFARGYDYTISVGAGGLGGLDNAEPSSGSETTVYGPLGQSWIAHAGGRGAGYVNNSTPDDGASGGGGSYYGQAGELGWQRQGGKSIHPGGNDGGNGDYGTGKSGGGGGAGLAGENNDEEKAGKGGDGLPNSITGSEVYYAGGGGGGIQAGYGEPNVGGLGGGGSATSPLLSGRHGTDGLGGGGAGNHDNGSQASGGNGGDGIVIIRAKQEAESTEGDPTVTKDGEYTIYSFTGFGAIKF